VKKFETEILSKLLFGRGLEVLFELLENSKQVIEFSGVGYFLTIKDLRLPTERFVLVSPA
jgi:hypothetical protein